MRNLFQIVICASLLGIAAPPALPKGSGEAGAPPSAGETSQVNVAQPPVTLSALGSQDLAAFLSGMDADRLLLYELRKEPPNDRKEAEAYLKRLKELASLADPVRLVPKANRVLEQAPLYYDWLEKDFEDSAERVSEYYVGGAQGFQIAFDEFKSMTLLTVINRLEIASRTLREIETYWK